MLRGQEEPDRVIDFDRLAFFDLRVPPALLEHDLKLVVRQRTMAGHAVHRLPQLVGRQITIIVPISLLEGLPQLFLLSAGRGQRVAVNAARLHERRARLISRLWPTLEARSEA